MNCMNEILFGFLQQCQRIRSFSIWKRSTGEIRAFYMALEWSIIILTRTDGKFTMNIINLLK